MRRYALAVSIAHLFFLAFYVESGGIRPWQTVSPVAGFGEILQFTVLMLSGAAAPFVLGALAWAVDTGVRRRRRAWTTTARELAFLMLGAGALLALVNAMLRMEASFGVAAIGRLITFTGERTVLALGLGLATSTAAIIVLLLAAPLREVLVRWLRGVFYILAPTALFSVAGMLYVLAVVLSNAASLDDSDTVSTRQAQRPIAPGAPTNVVVLLFDGFSYAVGFNGGEVDHRLPNLEALAAQSMVFHNVSSFPGRTTHNVPVMLTGRNYVAYEFGDAAEGDIAHLGDGTQVRLKDQRNLFDIALENGYSTTVFGMYIDYCGTYMKGRGDCRFAPFGRLPLPSPTVLEAILDPYRLALSKLLSIRVELRVSRALGRNLDEEKNYRLYTLNRHNALVSALDAAEGIFAYEHYPIPHNTTMELDEDSGRLNPAGTLFDTFEVVDAFIGQIRRVLEESGTWEDTLLVVVADHNEETETSDPRVPLLIKLPNAAGRIDFSGYWTHEQFLPMFEELFRRRSFDADSLLSIVESLTSIGD